MDLGLCNPMAKCKVQSQSGKKEIFAVAQVSVFGTGMSNHCMDFMGLSEQMGIDAAVTWLGTQEYG